MFWHAYLKAASQSSFVLNHCLLFFKLLKRNCISLQIETTLKANDYKFSHVKGYQVCCFLTDCYKFDALIKQCMRYFKYLPIVHKKHFSYICNAFLFRVYNLSFVNYLVAVVSLPLLSLYRLPSLELTRKGQVFALCLLYRFILDKNADLLCRSSEYVLLPIGEKDLLLVSSANGHLLKFIQLC